jgi:hypothetical protein
MHSKEIKRLQSISENFMKKIILIYLVFLLSACGEETVYLDSETGKVVEPPKPSIKHFSPAEVCLNGVVYYDLGYHPGNFTPKLVLKDKVGNGKALTGVEC